VFILKCSSEIIVWVSWSCYRLVTHALYQDILHFGSSGKWTHFGCVSVLPGLCYYFVLVSGVIWVNIAVDLWPAISLSQQWYLIAVKLWVYEPGSLPAAPWEGKLCQAQVNVNENGQNMSVLWEDIFVKSVDIQTPATSKLGFIISDVESALETLWYLEVDLMLQIMHENLW